MKKRILRPKGDYHYFSDALNDNQLYCLTGETLKEVDPILRKLRHFPSDVAGKNTVKAFPLAKIEENELSVSYDIIVTEPIDFVINRIKMEWVFHDPDLNQ